MELNLLSRDIEKLLNGYWWKSSNSNRRGIRWLAWERMCKSKDRGGLGFRSLHGFNIALLGKHVWNFLKNPNSLVARVFRARYFPDCHVLRAQKGEGGSFIWGGIFEAKEELFKGFKWVLGDVWCINMFSDQWLRGKQDYRVEDHHVNMHSVDRVCEYFRPNTKEWDVTKVRQTFQDMDVQCILQTRIPQNQTSDRVAWMGTSNGIYSEKSGYHFWFDRNHITTEEDLSKGWGKLWNLQIPHKAKYFLWRLCKNNIPIRNLLKGKGVQTTIMCPFYNRDVEHLRHVFLECPYAQSCWLTTGVEIDVMEVEELPGWLLGKLCSTSIDKLTTMAATLWGIWMARNKCVWENKKMEPNIAMQLSLRLVNEWQVAQKTVVSMRKTSNQGGGSGQAKWTLPDAGWYKMNVDATIQEGQAGFQIGMILRNDRGDFVSGMNKGIRGLATVMEAEATGVWEALRWIQTSGVQQVVVETDSLIVVNALNHNMEYQVEVGDILNSCREILRDRSDLSVKHICRQANRLAHTLAKLPCLSGSVDVFHSPPSGVVEMLRSDCLS